MAALVSGASGDLGFETDEGTSVSCPLLHRRLALCRRTVTSWHMEPSPMLGD
jgi:hypothetical protein